MSTALKEWSKLAPAPGPLPGGQEWTVFLSYRSVNRPWVINLYDVLRGHGHTVFLDQVVLGAGDQLTRTLEDGLGKSAAGVLVWSSATADSEWVRREYEVMERQATKRGFHFVPLRLDDAELPLFAESRVFLDFSSYPDGPNGGELLRLLHAVVGQPLSPEAAHFAAEQDEAARRTTAQIKAAIRNGSAARLRKLYEEDGLPWQTSAAVGCAAAEGLTRLKEYDAAIEMLADIRTRFPRAIRPQQLEALARARRDAEDDLDEAQAILGELYELGERDPETLGIYARTWMDRYGKSGDARHLRRSRELYAEAFDGAQDDYYTGVNAAAKSVFLGEPADLEAARGYAERVQKIVGSEPVPADYWKTATIGEVFLMQSDYARAAQLYQAAVDGAPEERGSHETTWKQACRLMAKLSPSADDRALIRKVFAHLPDCTEG